MKGILVDENVPFHHHLPTDLKLIGARTLGYSPTDSEIWEYAKEHDLVILTKDADFFNRLFVSSPPPRVVQVKLGNMRKKEFHHILSLAWPQVGSLLKHHKLVRVHQDRLEGI